jgi:hypothetical protein
MAKGDNDQSMTKAKWSISPESRDWKRTIGAKVIEPAVEFVVRTAELMLLTGAFQAAARATESVALQVISAIVFFTLAIHFGLGWARFVLMPLERVRVPATWMNLVLILVPLALIAWLNVFLWREIGEVTKQLVPAK